MFVTMRLLTLPEDSGMERDELVRALRSISDALPGVTGAWVAPVSKTATINAGDIVWRTTSITETAALQLSDTAAWREQVAPLLGGVAQTTVGYRITNATVRRKGSGIWRALIFRTFADAEPALIRQLHDATLLLPHHVREIRSWALSRVAFTQGPKAFTHVWEQEFDRLEDLTGPYMTDPAHWGIADAYFDAEYPGYIVDPQLIQVVGMIDDSIMAPVGPQSQELAA